MNKVLLSPKEVAQSLAITDLTDPNNGIHAINLVFDKIVRALESNITYTKRTIVRGKRLTTVNENFDNLLFPKNHPIRSSLHTRYVTEETIFRTQTSSLVPAVIAEMHECGVKESLILCTCLCFRKQKEHRLYCAEPHQLDIWLVLSLSNHTEDDELLKLIKTVADCIVPCGLYTTADIGKDISMSHPYLKKVLKTRTEYKDEVVSVLEAGIVSKDFLERMNIDHRKYFAVSVGIILDRAVMLIKGLDDVRLLRSEDERVSSQMLTLKKFKPVSKYPATIRDISVIMSCSLTKKDVLSEITSSLSNESTLLDEVIVLSETPFEALPEDARLRLGIVPGQKNMLIRMIFRSHERTLKRDEGDHLTEKARALF